MARATYEVQPGQEVVVILGGQPSETGAFSPSYFPPSLAAGTVGVQIVPLAGGLAVVARTTTPREQATNSAIYAATLTAPLETGVYSVLWDHNAGAAPFLSQTMNVGVNVPVTLPGGIPGDGVAGDSPVYITACAGSAPTATNEDLEAYMRGLVVDDPVAMNQLIVQCEYEIDAILGLWIRNPATGRKINVSNVIPVAPISPFPGELFAPFQRGVTVYQRSALRRAVCAQVEYHLKMGEDFFIKPRYQSVSGPQFSYTRGAGETPDLISPKARQHLDGTGLIRQTARAIV